MDELTQEQLDELRGDLLALKVSLRQDLDASVNSSKPVALDQNSVGRVSRIDAIQHQQMAAASRQAQTHRVTMTDQALGRFEAEIYGFCLRCEEPIGYRRLKARPESAQCVRCANASRPR